MPYITKQKRENFKDLEELLLCVRFESPGDLNYLLTLICKEYLLDKKESYQTYNDIVGALECCKLELVRRRLNSYEDGKIKLNGDVY